MRTLYCAALMGAVGCSAPVDGVRSSRAAILGGVVDQQDPQVGMLEFASGRFGTATLIAPDVVLTAGHVVGGNIQAFYTGTGIPSGQLDNTTSSPTMVRHEIGAKIVHPSYQSGTLADTCGDVSGGVILDVGLVQLVEPITDVAPFDLDATVPQVGDVCRSVGFGMHESEVPDASADRDMATVKQKREADETVLSLGPPCLLLDRGTGIAAEGDSGGPLFCNSKIVAVVTSHSDSSSVVLHRQESYTRIDLALPWIQQQVAAWHASPDAGTDAAPAATDAGSAGGGHGCSVSWTSGRATEPGLVFGLLAVATVLLRRRRRALP